MPRLLGASEQCEPKTLPGDLWLELDVGKDRRVDKEWTRLFRWHWALISWLCGCVHMSRNLAFTSEPSPHQRCIFKKPDLWG